MRTNLPPRWRRRGVAAGPVAVALVALGCSLGADVVAYDLPAEEARYTLATDIDGVHTEWKYTSGRPAEDGAHELQPCMGEYLGTEPAACRPEPLIFLRYDLGLDLDDTLPAARFHRVTITGYYQDLEPSLVVTDLRLEVTFDGGESWRPVRTRPTGEEGTFRATIRHPRLAETNGGVGLRVDAVDSGGNTVVQTIPHAYRLR